MNLLLMHAQVLQQPCRDSHNSMLTSVFPAAPIGSSDVSTLAVPITVYAPYCTATKKTCMLQCLTQHSYLVPQQMLAARLVPTCSNHDLAALTRQHCRPVYHASSTARQACSDKPNIDQPGNMSCVMCCTLYYMSCTADLQEAIKLR